MLIFLPFISFYWVVFRPGPNNVVTVLYCYQMSVKWREYHVIKVTFASHRLTQIDLLHCCTHCMQPWQLAVSDSAIQQLKTLQHDELLALLTQVCINDADNFKNNWPLLFQRGPVVNLLWFCFVFVAPTLGGTCSFSRNSFTSPENHLFLLFYFERIVKS